MQKALKSVKDGKATGTDELPAEALKALDEHNIEIIASLCNIIYKSGMIPTEMKHSVFITHCIRLFHNKKDMPRLNNELVHW